MSENYKKYDLILQNTASKQEWVLKGLVNVSTVNLYYQFNNFSMPTDAPTGEYFYALIWNVRTDVEYTLRDDILDTIVTTGEGSIKLKDLQPETGILRYGTVEQKNNYRNKNTDFIYRK